MADSKQNHVQPDAPSSKSRIEYHIAIPPAGVAQDTALVSYLTQLVNEVYAEAEAGIFDEHYVRTNTAEIAQYLLSGSLALASTDATSPWDPPEKIQGCVRIVAISPTMGEVGMLVAAPGSRGSGLGGQLVAFAERECKGRGARRMMLELVVPTEFEHGLKTWVSAWYQRLGYRIVGTSDFRKAYPRIADRVVVSTVYNRFEKDI